MHIGTAIPCQPQAFHNNKQGLSFMSCSRGVMAKDMDHKVLGSNFGIIHFVILSML